MSDDSKSKNQLRQEVKQLRERVAELESQVGQSDSAGEAYQHLFEDIAQGVVCQDADGNITSANRAACSILGLSLDQMQGRTSFDPRWRAIHEDGTDYPGDEHPAMMALASGKPVRNVVMGVHSPLLDKLRWININAIPRVRTGDDRAYQVFTTFDDITDRKRAEEALRESEAQHSQAQRVARIGHWELDSYDGTPRWSDEVFRIFGVDPQMGEPSFTTHDTIIHPDEWSLLDRSIKDGFEQGKPFNLVFKILRPGGEIGWMHAIGEPGTDGDGNVAKMFGTAQDITEHRLAEEALRESEGKYRLLADNAADVIWTADANLKFTFFSPSVLRLRGYVPEEAVAQSVEEIMTPESLGVAMNLFAEEMVLVQQGDYSEGKNRTCNLEFTCKDGSTVWAEVSMRFLFDNERKLVGVLGIARDITERRRAEEALREANEFLPNIVNAIADPVFVKNDAFEFVFVNTELCTLLGKAREEIIGTTGMEYLPQDQMDHFLEVDQLVLSSGEENACEELLTDGGGEIRTILTKKTRFVDAKGAKFIVGVIRDFTELRLSEVSLRKSQEQLQQAQKMESIGRLAGGVAHDFNNLLTAILGNSELMAFDLGEGDPLLDGLAEIDKAAKRATTLTAQLLAFSRKQVLQPRVIDLNATVQDIEKMLRRLIGEDIELTIVLEPNLGHVNADTGQIGQVLMNLAVNARDAMPEGGKLTIESANVDLDESNTSRDPDVQPGPHVVIAVSDSGFGMDKETLSKVFEPFFTTKDKSKGTGLGLSMVYGLIKQSGGHIWASSEPGHGTTFKVYLPRVEEAAPVPETKAPASDLQGTETILIVEDEQVVKNLIATILKRYGYTVLEADGGEEALSVAESHPDSIHLVLTDVVMPGASGKEVATALTANCPELKVLYMSGYTDDAIGHHGVLDEGTNFIMKPFSPTSLAMKVREVLDG